MLLDRADKRCNRGEAYRIHPQRQKNTSMHVRFCSRRRLDGLVAEDGASHD
jgi:hypothetical protein